jgi:hypothetical protein
MSERERWVVYPLLFLALGASLRDKIGGRTIAKSIVCQELTVVADEPVGREPVRILARIGRSSQLPGAGEIEVNGAVNVSKYYAFRGVPIFPSVEFVPPTAPAVGPVPGRKSATNETDEKAPRPGDSSRDSPPAGKSADEAAPQN